MEKKTRKVPVTKTTVVGHKTESYIVTSDGKEWPASKEFEASQHEKYVEENRRRNEILASIKRTYAEFPDVIWSDNTEWFFCETREQMETLFEYLGLAGKHAISPRYLRVHGDLKVGEWFCRVIEDGGDAMDTHRFYTYEYVRGEFEKFISHFDKSRE